MKKEMKFTELMSFYEACGVDEIIQPTPVQRAHKDMPSKIPVPAQPKILQALPKTEDQNNKHTLPQRAEALAKAATTLEALKNIIENFDDCDLKKTALNTVFSDGNPNSDIMLIGEAPGADEDRLGKPFVGKSGQLLDSIISEIGLSRLTNCYITNVIFWRPPGNRTPTAGELALCKPFVDRHIELFNPKIIILVGSSALKSLIKNPLGIMKMRGQWLEAGPLNTPTLAIFHPAFLLRSPGQKRYVWQDMLMLKDKIEELALIKNENNA